MIRISTMFSGDPNISLVWHSKVQKFSGQIFFPCMSQPLKITPSTHQTHPKHTPAPVTGSPQQGCQPPAGGQFNDLSRSTMSVIFISQISYIDKKYCYIFVWLGIQKFNVTPRISRGSNVSFFAALCCCCLDLKVLLALSQLACPPKIGRRQ